MARYRSKSRDVKIYRVGGSVRDELLGRPVVDRDWVVVGATPEILVASGYKPVGRDFPVFIHHDTGEEYALARTERKHGRGYRGFEFFASPDVTLAEDLARRDLTINAMARDEKGALIDPFGGQADLRAGSSARFSGIRRRSAARAARRAVRRALRVCGGAGDRAPHARAGRLGGTRRTGGGARLAGACARSDGTASGAPA
jgi:hypothetical protein